MIFDRSLCPRDTGESGVLTLPENLGASDLPPVSCVAWPADMPNGHAMENRTDRPVTHIVAGSRQTAHEVTCPDIDLHYMRRNGLRARLHKDATPYPGWPKETNR